MPLSGGFDQPFPPGAKDIAAVKFELATQLIDGLLVFLGRLVVELRRLIELRRGGPRPAERAGSAGRDMRQDRWAMTLE